MSDKYSIEDVPGEALIHVYHGVRTQVAYACRKLGATATCVDRQPDYTVPELRKQVDVINRLVGVLETLQSLIEEYETDKADRTSQYSVTLKVSDVQMHEDKLPPEEGKVKLRKLDCSHIKAVGLTQPKKQEGDE